MNLFGSIELTHVLLLFFCFDSFVHRGTPVLTSLGFCITFLSLLSIGFPSIFANRKDYFIRMVPYSQLSTPEGYLKGIECDVETLEILESTETGAASTEKDSATKIEEDLAVPTNEETPLLS